ncbi:ras GEF [Testicularia cyperi]|uniref:Ras GEF n=1 Tax=Testicularia cyperi TaxID=1882483 RepID=A0A317XLM9_9BASI|nr:ras GEF [Testicularia cyperi]
MPPPDPLIRTVEPSAAGGALSPTQQARSLPSEPIDVETTNWNAVKILASQHGIDSASLDQIRTAVAASDDPSRDFGVDTPFHITALRLENGRVVYRFRSRDAFPAHSGSSDRAAQLDSAISEFGVPRSSSSGAVFPHHDPASGSFSSLLRMTGNLSLKQSKSIPVLRRKASGNLVANHLPAAAPSQATVAESYPVFGTIMGGGITFPTLSSSSNAASSSRVPAPPTSPGAQTGHLAAAFRPRELGQSTPMARGASAPVTGAHAMRHLIGHLEEGDVLGAVLGLRHEEIWSGRAKHGTQPSATKRTAPSNFSSSASSTGSPRSPLQPSDTLPPDSSALAEPFLPKLDFGSGFAKSPRLHQLREAQSFESNASDSTARAGDDGDGDNSLDSEAGEAATNQTGHALQLNILDYPAELQPHLLAAIQNVSGDGNGDHPARHTLIYDVLQCYHRRTASMPPQTAAAAGSLRAQLSPGSRQHRRFNSTELAMQTSAAPGDDPRFAIWAVRNDADDGSYIISDRHGRVDGPETLTPSHSASSFPAIAALGTRGSPLDRRLSARMAGMMDGGSNKPADFSPAETGSHRSSGSGKASSASSRRRVSSSSKPILLAASVARLVAELTAEIDQPFLIDFLMTYRAFLDPLDLLELLTLRFEWAVADASSAEDDARRRIVRVRTFVVLRHWLLNHFDHDFLPNRALRQRLANWLNQTASDERIRKRPADLSIVNSLRKVVRNLKETYSHTGVGGLLLHDAGRVASGESEGKNASVSTRTSSKSFASTSSGGGHRSSNDRAPQAGLRASTATAEEINLDFSDDQAAQDPSRHARAVSGGLDPSGFAPTSKPKDVPRNDTAAQKASADSVILAPRPGPSPSMRTSRVSIKVPGVSQSNLTSPPAPLPHASSALSRAFVQTVGRLSRFKRVLGSRGLSVDPSHDLDVDLNDCNDLLFTKGGLESLIQFFELDPLRSPQQALTTRQFAKPLKQRPATLAEEDEEEPASHMSEDSTGVEETPSLNGASTTRSTPASSIDLTAHVPKHPATDGLGIVSVSASASVTVEDHFVGESAQPLQDPLALDIGSLAPVARPKLAARTSDHLHHTTSEQTLRSVSQLQETETEVSEAIREQPLEQQAHDAKMSAKRVSSRLSSRFGTQRARESFRHSAMSGDGPRIVQIDDIDLSSDDDDYAVRRALRRLPGARNLREANTVRDIEPVPAGRSSVDSMASSMYQGAFHPVLASTGVVGTRRSMASTFSAKHGRSVSVDSFALRPDVHSANHAPPIIGIVHSEMLDPDEALQGYELVKGFNLDGIESDEEEPGDVEAALRRLEGIIDEGRQKAKAKRVEKLWLRSLARNAEVDGSQSGDRPESVSARHISMSSRASKSEGPPSSAHTGGSFADNEDEDNSASLDLAESVIADGSQSGADRDAAAAAVREVEVPEAETSFLDLQESASASEAESHSSAPGASLSPRSPARAAHTTGSSAGTWMRTQMQSPQRQQRSLPTLGGPPSPKVGLPSLPPVHRSFLLAFRSETVARQMCLIEAELLRSVDWDELSSARWKERRYGSEVTDWEVFYRDRVRDRLEAQRLGLVYHDRSVEAIVARFNLTSNWVASEVVLTQSIEERAAVICKLIRIAWKCYQQSNFASLAQIIFGLSTPWVERLRRTWNRVGYYEMRIWKDLNSFVGPKNNFRHLRNAMLQLIDGVSGIEDESIVSSGPNGGGNATSSAQSNATRGCIPFFGLFLSDLMVNDALPTFLDPTNPTQPARFEKVPCEDRPSVDADSAAEALPSRFRPSRPDAFASLPPLPPSVKLEPLVNVHKFRNTAHIIQQISAFQMAAKNYSALFEAEKGAYVRCLKLRCLSGDLLARLSHMVEP